ncbi:hypothetical protein Zmor_003374 [Zophobas morio]|uniref:Uncharacterized protein n=1 Tax=Zophobas morio TaxID=2755281 RepID=A0AA38HMK3_9CUCU|nr:hypothetical protein Zmor_003374 [Zophobas morio]
MAISSTTDWSKIRYIMFVVFFVSALLASTVATGLTTSGKQKRQLFREHLLPQRGGRIPDGAFEPNRLILNKFSQNGLYSPDGYHLDQRHPEPHHTPKQPFPKTVKVHLYPDGRYVAPPGQYRGSQTVDTTYLIREPVNFVLLPPVKHYTPFPTFPHYSLKILRHFKYEKGNNKFDGKWNEISGNDELPMKILSEFAPYLRKIHETD